MDALEQGLRPDAVVTEVGSGRTGRRVKFRRLLPEPGVDSIVVEHRDRAARFGVEILRAALGATGGGLARRDHLGRSGSRAETGAS